MTEDHQKELQSLEVRNMLCNVILPYGDNNTMLHYGELGPQDQLSRNQLIALKIPSLCLALCCNITVVETGTTH